MRSDARSTPRPKRAPSPSLAAYPLAVAMAPTATGASQWWPASVPSARRNSSASHSRIGRVRRSAVLRWVYPCTAAARTAAVPPSTVRSHARRTLPTASEGTADAARVASTMAALAASSSRKAQ
jgi:hypothetical protein